MRWLEPPDNAEGSHSRRSRCGIRHTGFFTPQIHAVLAIRTALSDRSGTYIHCVAREYVHEKSGSPSHSTVMGSRFIFPPLLRAYWQVGAAVGLVSQYTRVPKLSGPCRAIAALRFVALTDASVVE